MQVLSGINSLGIGFFPSFNQNMYPPSLYSFHNNSNTPSTTSSSFNSPFHFYNKPITDAHHKLKRKREEDVKMKDEARPTKNTKIDVNNLCYETPSNVTIKEIDSSTPDNFSQTFHVEEPEVDQYFTEDQRKPNSWKFSELEGNQNNEIVLYKSLKMPENLQDILRNHLTFYSNPENGSISPEDALFLRNLFHRSLTSGEARIVEITDEEEKQLLKQKEQKRVENIEEGIQRMEID